MEHNWYETTVTTSIPHRIIGVVDWASDSPTPIPFVGEDECGFIPDPRL